MAKTTEKNSFSDDENNNLNEGSKGKFTKRIFNTNNIKSKLNEYKINHNPPPKQTADKEAELAEKLKNTQQELIRTKNQLVRLASDYDLMNKKKEREVLESKEFAVSKFVKDIIEPFENLYRIQNHIKAQNQEKDAIGLEMTLNEFIKLFKKNGLLRIFPLGEKFDHNLHEVVSTIYIPDKEIGVVHEVLQAGYVLNNRLIKAATVVITKQENE